MTETPETQLAAIKKSIEAETVSYGEIIELQAIATARPDLIAGDCLLSQWAGISERNYSK